MRQDVHISADNEVLKNLDVVAKEIQKISYQWELTNRIRIIELSKSSGLMTDECVKEELRKLWTACSK